MEKQGTKTLTRRRFMTFKEWCEKWQQKDAKLQRELTELDSQLDQLTADAAAELKPLTEKKFGEKEDEINAHWKKLKTNNITRLCGYDDDRESIYQYMVDTLGMTHPENMIVIQYCILPGELLFTRVIDDNLLLFAGNYEMEWKEEL